MKSVTRSFMILAMLALASACGTSEFPKGNAGSGASAPKPNAKHKTQSTAKHETPTTKDIAWANQIVLDSGAVSGLMTRAGQAANDGDVTTLTSDCVEGATKIVPWLVNGEAIPVESIRSPYVSALKSFQKSFNECLAGDYAGAASDITDGSAKLDEASKATTDYTQSLGG